MKWAGYHYSPLTLGQLYDITSIMTQFLTPGHTSPGQGHDDAGVWSQSCHSRCHLLITILLSVTITIACVVV